MTTLGSITMTSPVARSSDDTIKLATTVAIRLAGALTVFAGLILTTQALIATSSLITMIYWQQLEPLADLDINMGRVRRDDRLLHVGVGAGGRGLGRAANGLGEAPSPIRYPGKVVRLASRARLALRAVQEQFEAIFHLQPECEHQGRSRRLDAPVPMSTCMLVRDTVGKDRG